TAAFLNLEQKGYIKEVEEDTFNVFNRDTDYPYERFMIDWLFDEVGHDGVFKLTDLKTYTDDTKNSKKYFNDSKDWEKLIKEEVKQSGVRERKVPSRIFMGLLSITIIPLIIYLFIYQLFGYMTISIVLFLTLSITALSYRPVTIKGRRIKRDWKE